MEVADDAPLLGAGVREAGIREGEKAPDRNRPDADRLPAAIGATEIDCPAARERVPGSAWASITLCSLRADGTCRASGTSRSRYSGRASKPTRSVGCP
jgi:hypothetical protein